MTRQLPFSARLKSSTTDSVVPDGNYQITFQIYTQATNGSALWTETQTVPVSGGSLSVMLGSTTPLPADLTFNDGDYYLGITVGVDDEMSPRKKIGAVPLALNADTVDGVRVGTEANNILLLDGSGNINIQGGATFGGGITVGGSILPSTAGLNIGSSTNHFASIFVDSITATTATLSGTDSPIFTINTGQTTNNTDTSSLSFYLGPTLNAYAALQWNGPANRFDLLSRVDAGTVANLKVGNLISGLATLQLPTTSDVLVGRNTTDTLQNKTLTSAQLTDPTITGTISASSVVATFGATTTGDLTVNGLASTTGTLHSGGDFSIGSSKLTVVSASGNTNIEGTLRVVGDSSFATLSTSSLATADSLEVTNGTNLLGGLTAHGAVSIQNSLQVTGDTTLGDTSADRITLNGLINSNIRPAADNTYDLGSGALRFKNFYAANAIFDSLSTSNSTSNSFVINSDNATSDAEDATLEFSRGGVSPNAIIAWDSGNTRFDLNQDVLIQGNTTLGNASTDSTTIRGGLSLPDSSSTTALLFGGDSKLYRSSTSQLTTTADVLFANTAPASSGDTTNDSRTAVFQGAYWNGAASTQVTGAIGLLVQGTGPAYGLNFQTSGSTSRMYINQDGNVGINTTSPGSLLTVNGTANITGTTLLGGALTGTTATFAANSGTAISLTNSSVVVGRIGTNTSNQITLNTLSVTDNFIRFTTGAFGGQNTFPAIKRNGANLEFKLADDSAFTGITAQDGTFGGSLLVTGTINGSTISGGALSGGNVSGGTLSGGTYSNTGASGTGAYTLAALSGNLNLQASTGITNFNQTGVQNQIRVFASNGTSYISMTHDGTNGVVSSSSGALQLAGQGTNQFLLGDTGTAVNLVFQESSTISGRGVNTINIGVSGDTFNLNQSGVTYNVGNLTATSASLMTANNAATALTVNTPSNQSASLLDLQVAGSSKLLVSNTGALTVAGVTSSSAVAVTGNGSFTGTLGVGTVAPAAGVAAAIASGSAATNIFYGQNTDPNGAGAIAIQNNSTGVIRLGFGGTTVGQMTNQGFINSSNGLSIGVAGSTSTAFLFTSTGNLGIGTSTVRGRLDTIGTVTANAGYGLVNIGGAATLFDGATAGFFAGSSSGTQLAMNAASGFGGNLVDLQVAGSSKFKLDASGNLTLATSLISPTVTSAGALSITSAAASNITMTPGTSGKIRLVVSGNASAAVQIGDGGVTNYAQFDTNGALTFNGAARPFSEMQLVPAEATLPASGNCVLNTTDDTNHSFKTLDCAASVDKWANWQLKMPQNYVNGSNVQVDVSWVDTDSGSTNSARFDIGYTAVANGATWLGATRTDVTGSSVASAGQNKINTSTVTLTAPSINAGDQVSLRVLRKGTVDNLPDTAKIIEVRVRYLVNS